MNNDDEILDLKAQLHDTQQLLEMALKDCARLDRLEIFNGGITLCNMGGAKFAEILPTGKDSILDIGLRQAIDKLDGENKCQTCEGIGYLGHKSENDYQNCPQCKPSTT